MDINRPISKDSSSMQNPASVVNSVSHNLLDKRKHNPDSGYYSCSNIEESSNFNDMPKEVDSFNAKQMGRYNQQPVSCISQLNGHNSNPHNGGVYTSNGFPCLASNNLVDTNGNHISRLGLKASPNDNHSGHIGENIQQVNRKTCPTCASMCVTKNSIVNSGSGGRLSFTEGIITTTAMTSQSNNVSRSKEKVDAAAQDLAIKIEFCLKFGYTINQVRSVLSKLSYKATKNDILAELSNFSTTGGHIAHGHTSLPTPIDVETKFHSIDKDTQNLNIQPGDLVSHGISTSQSMLQCRGPSTLEHDSKTTKEAEDDSQNLRPIVIDGSNVAMSHGNKQYFSCKGIAIAVDHFRMRNHRDITVFIPTYRKESSRPDAPIRDREILEKLEQERILVYTPSRSINGKRVTCYDDRFILKLAQETDGIIVSNDNFRDLQNEKPEWKELIEKRLLMYSFVNDRFMPPDDPLGRNGPSIDNFLRKRPASEEQSKPQCPYGKKCTYGKKCKYFHPECAYSHKSVTDRLKEKTERRLKASNVAHSLAEEIMNSDRPKSNPEDRQVNEKEIGEYEVNHTEQTRHSYSQPNIGEIPEAISKSSSCAVYPAAVDSVTEQLQKVVSISNTSPSHLPSMPNTPNYSPVVSQPPPNQSPMYVPHPGSCGALDARNTRLQQTIVQNSSPAAFQGFDSSGGHQVLYNIPNQYQQIGHPFIQYHPVPYHDMHYPPHQRVMYPPYHNVRMPPNIMPQPVYVGSNHGSDGSSFSHSYPFIPSSENGMIPRIQHHANSSHTDTDPKTYPPRTSRRAYSSPHPHPPDVGHRPHTSYPLDSPQNPRHDLFKNLCGLFPRVTVEKVMNCNPSVCDPKSLIKMCLAESS
ncbi:uncharacterized protein LOC100183892 [Ciona intestinalis]